MRLLELDFQRPSVRPRRLAGWLLLLTGLALLLEMGVSYDRLQNDREAMKREIRTSKIRIDMPGKSDNTRKFTDSDFESARQIMGRLSTPWEGFFTGLEAVSAKKVAILSINPDMQTGLLRIEGEAKDYAAALTLVAQLRTTKPFSEVFLSHYEIKRDDPQHPIDFTISLHWMKPS